jgi:molybdate-binding protein
VRAALVERLYRVTGRKVSPENFRSVRTVSDLVDTVHQLVNQA